MADIESPENPLLRRRRNSITLPKTLTLHHQTSTTSTTTTTTTATSSSSSSTNSTTDEFDLFSTKPVSYTSLRDLLPHAAVNSPRPLGSESGSEISIRNRLVKQAAWAYLQPMSTSPDSSGHSFFFRRLFPVNNAITGIIDFFDKCFFAPLTRAVDWLLRVFRIRTSR